MRPVGVEALRPVHEARAALAWLLVAAHGPLLWSLGVDLRVAGGVFALGAMMGGWRSMQARALWRFQWRLAGGPPAQLPCGRFDRSADRLQDQLWLGWGFRWQARHTQLCQTLLQRPLDTLYPPAPVLRLLGLPPRPAETRGLPWVHGLDRERDVVLPVAALDGHTAVLAVTGAIKTVLARLLVYQLARRGDTVIVLDPKGDKDLEGVCRDVCVRLGEPERFQRLHLAFPQQSFRLDTLADTDRDTEVASRLRLLMGGRGDDTFAAFAWMSVTDIVAAMRFAGRRVTLRALLDVLRSPERAESLLLEALDRFHARRGDAPSGVRDIAAKAPPKGFPPRLAHAVQRFHAETPADAQPREITGLLALLAADRAWFTKMVAGLTPTLMRLTAGDLGSLLSPDHGDVDDARPIRSTRQLVAGRHVVYVGLDALSDTAVAEGVAALLLSELASEAGHLYHHASPRAQPPRRIHVLCDEWGDLVCDPLIQLANKGRGAGVVLYLFGQTLADLVVKLGDEARAKRVFGNMNNLIVGATSDGDTLDLVARKLGDTVVHRATVVRGAAQRTEDGALAHAATHGASLAEQEAPLVPPSVLAGLPDLHYVAILNRAQVYKGRIPVLSFDEPAAR